MLSAVADSDWRPRWIVVSHQKESESEQNEPAMTRIGFCLEDADFECFDGFKRTKEGGLEK